MHYFGGYATVFWIVVNRSMPQRKANERHGVNVQHGKSRPVQQANVDHSAVHSIP